MFSYRKRFLPILLSGSFALTASSSAASPMTACAGQDDGKERQIFAMTTVMNLKAYGDDADAALDDAEEKIRSLDSLLSTGTEGSEVYQINENGGGRLSDDTAALTEASMDLYQMTEGAFDFTIYPIMDLWGFTRLFGENVSSSASSLSETESGGLSDNERLISHVPTEDEIDALLPLVDSSKVSYDAAAKTMALPEGVKIDFGGIAKGYASQKVMDIFKGHGLTGGLADLGGNIQVTGKKPDGSAWRVGIEDPDDSSAVLGILSLEKDGTVITSGGYERYLVDLDGKHYPHIIDPATGYPVENDLSSVSILCDDGTLADGLSTSLCVMGKEKAIGFWKEHPDLFDMVLFDTDKQITVSEGLKDSFVSAKYDVTVVNAD